MTEFIIVLPALLLLILGALQFAFIYSAKITLNYATFQAARLSALNNASYQSARRGLAQGLAPMFTHSADMAALKKAKETAEFEIDNYTRTTRINPADAHFLLSAHGEYDDEGEIFIPNDNLMYRDPTPKGNPALSIQDANILKLQVEYCYQLVVPFINTVISKWFTEGDDDLGVAGDPNYYTSGFGSLCGNGQRKGIVLRSSSIVRMQSAAYEAFE